MPLAPKTKTIALIAGIAFVLVVAALAVAWCWPESPPFELTPLSYKPATGPESILLYAGEEAHMRALGLSTNQMFKLTCRYVQDYAVPLLTSQTDVGAQGHWVKLADTANGIESLPWFNVSAPTNHQLMLLLPGGAETCRVTFTYVSFHRGLPFGIGDPMARGYWADPGSPGGKTPAQRARHIAYLISPKLYNWLWPDFDRARWKTATVQINLTNLTTTTTITDATRMVHKMTEFE